MNEPTKRVAAAAALSVLMIPLLGCGACEDAVPDCIPLPGSTNTCESMLADDESWDLPPLDGTAWSPDAG